MFQRELDRSTVCAATPQPSTNRAHLSIVLPSEAVLAYADVLSAAIDFAYAAMPFATVTVRVAEAANEQIGHIDRDPLFEDALMYRFASA